MLKIGDFSKLSRISIRMLRHYNEIELLIPEKIDEENGYRYYSATQLIIANRITMLKDMGFNLATIKQILEQYSDATALEQYLLIKYSEVQEQLAVVTNQLNLIEHTIDRLRKDTDMMEYTVVLKEVPKRDVISLRGVIPSYDREGMLWQQIMEEVTAQNVRLGNPCYSMAIFHDQGYKESDVDVEIQMAVQGIYNDSEKVKFKPVAALQVASITFQGGYEQMTAISEVVANWLVDHEYTFNGPMFNIYHVGPATEKNPEQWITEVCFPVCKG